MCKKIPENGQNRANIAQNKGFSQNPQKLLFFENFQICLQGPYGHPKSEKFQKCQKSLFFHLNNHIRGYVEGYMSITPILYGVTLPIHYRYT